MQNIRNQELLNKFGANLRKFRELRGKTQEELAEDAGISQVQVARIEMGKVNTTISTAHLLMTALQIEPNQLFE